MAQINMPSRRQDDDPLTMVMKGLQIASQVYGIRSAQAQLDNFADQKAASEIKVKQDAEDRAFIQGGGLLPTQRMSLLGQNFKETPVDANTPLLPGATKATVYTPEGPQVMQYQAPKSAAEIAADKAIADEQRQRMEQLQKAADTRFENEKSIRTQYDNLSKDTRAVMQAYGKIDAAMQDQTPASNMSLIFNYMKMLDPQSTVREGEYATAENARGVPDFIRNLYDKTVDGTILTDTQRKDFAHETEKIMNEYLQLQAATDAQYTGIAERRGLDVRNIIDPRFQDQLQIFKQRFNPRGTAQTAPQTPPAATGFDMFSQPAQASQPFDPNAFLREMNPNARR